MENVILLSPADDSHFQAVTSQYTTEMSSYCCLMP